MRLTSNLIYPSGPVQTFKVSIGNTSLHLLNKRGGYESENSKISCARIVFAPHQIRSNSKKVSLPYSVDDALSKLGFVAIGSVDYVEAALMLVSSQSFRQLSSGDVNAPEADATLSLSLGNVCVYACKDSCNCLMDTINELVLKITMPSHEELETMRAEFFSQLPQLDSIDTALQGDNESSSSLDLHVSPESVSLSDVLSHGLFTGEDALNFNNQIFEEIIDVNDNRSRTSTLSTLPEYKNEKSTFIESDSSHKLIDDFYEISNMSNHDDDNPSREQIDCWTAIEHPWSDDPSIPEGEEQSARWYTWDYDDDRKIESTVSQLMLPNGSTVIVEGNPGRRKPRIFNRHVPLQTSSDPLSDGDMGASSYAGGNKVQVKLRILIKDMSFRCRLFDGFDYPESPVLKEKESTNTREKLLGALMGDLEANDSSLVFANSATQTNTRKPTQPRQSCRYFQFAISGLKLRSDSFSQSKEHHLVSCTELNFTDMHLIETVSSDKPVKLLGEWVNQEEHPRDTNDGFFMMKVSKITHFSIFAVRTLLCHLCSNSFFQMVSLYPETQFSADGKLMGNEAHVIIELLPMRFFIHQIALRFIRNFFNNDQELIEDDTYTIDKPPDMFFPSFRVKSFDIKVDYKPLEVDKSALKEGSYIQLLNLLPLEDMILRLNGVEMRNLTGWGAIISELACKWLQDVSSTQMHKFLTQTRPLHPIANVGDSVKNFVLLPLKEYKQRGNVQRALRKGTSKLVGVVAYETLSVGAKLTGYAAKKLNNKRILSSSETTSVPSTSLASSRPKSSTLPRNMGDVSDRAIESLSRGLKEANAKIIIMPYREYQKTGTKGAMKTVVKGIPVAVCAPLSGAVEALSHGLYGASNQLRPDLFEEREASKRFHDDEEDI